MADIKPMRRVSAYRTSDDRLHNTRPAAIRHQAALDLAAWLAPRINSIGAEAAELAALMIDDARGDGGIIDLLTKGTMPDSKRAA